jgi:hypothetical protein
MMNENRITRGKPLIFRNYVMRIEVRHIR